MQYFQKDGIITFTLVLFSLFVKRHNIFYLITLQIKTKKLNHIKMADLEKIPVLHINYIEIFMLLRGIFKTSYKIFFLCSLR